MTVKSSDLHTKRNSTSNSNKTSILKTPKLSDLTQSLIQPTSFSQGTYLDYEIKIFHYLLTFKYFQHKNTEDVNLILLMIKFSKIKIFLYF